MGRDLELADRLYADPVLAPHVVEMAGWRERGSDRFDPDGFVWHHTAGPRSGAAPSLTICTYGRRDLPGPLCNVFLARDGRVFVVAAGRANHAGPGGWGGLAGNSSVYGLEIENVGTPAEPWSELLLDRAARIAAAMPVPVDRCCHHREWTRRKVDMHTVAGDDMRRRVQHCRAHRTTPPPAPAAAQVLTPSPSEATMFLVLEGVGIFAVVDGIPISFDSLEQYAAAKAESPGVPVMTLHGDQATRMHAWLTAKLERVFA